jgi:hypothetical protein
MLMGRIEGTNGKATARFVQPMRAKAWRQWTPDEVAIVERSITLGLTLDQTHALLPYRTRDSVKVRFYELRPLELREKLPREKTDIMDEIDVQKDAVQGSAKLLEALLGMTRERKAG